VTADKAPAHLFVYGTLMRKSRSPYAQLLRTRALYIGEASAPGRLYHLGGFPGAVFDEGSSTRVYGEVFQLRGPAVLVSLDAYEGCDAQGSKTGNFRREIINAALLRGGTLAAWSYSFTGPVNGRPLIATGRYRLR
jgi:gamma-glutamylcyclotransferase (GGCT)/AIG2-like uncharacterized protein YtfP